jgi:cation:H+ antiporter
MIFLYFALLILSFAVLFKCADLFVSGAVGIAHVTRIPKMVVGIVLVGLATTAPEFGVSVQASFLGHPEIALGNAIGSVICDDGLALALAAVFSASAIMVNCRLLRTAAVFLLSIDVMAYLLARNGTVGRLEGIVFIFILCLYYIYIIRKRDSRLVEEKAIPPREEKADQPPKAVFSVKRSLVLFLIGIAGVAISSRVVIWASINIAQHFSISETIIGLTIIAIGTSLPEISTCITAALRGEGEIAVGDIIGADILNILWIIGVSSIANPITVDLEVINFTFPYMILIVAVMLVSVHIGCRLTKAKGAVLFALYILYFFLTILLFT